MRRMFTNQFHANVRQCNVEVEGRPAEHTSMGSILLARPLSVPVNTSQQPTIASDAMGGRFSSTFCRHSAKPRQPTKRHAPCPRCPRGKAISRLRSRCFRPLAPIKAIMGVEESELSAALRLDMAAPESRDSANRKFPCGNCGLTMNVETHYRLK